MFGGRLKTTMVGAEQALAGRAAPAFRTADRHTVLGTTLHGPWPEGTAVACLALGCFWGAERAFWNLPGVVTTAVCYQGGHTPNPTYEEVCTGRTGHTETVLVAYDPAKLSHTELMREFWTSHDPTQGYRQGNDLGTQYRSALFFTTPEQEAAAVVTREAYSDRLAASGFGAITTEIRPVSDAGEFYYAEDYHQQYLAKNPNGYCGLGGTGVACPMPLR
jgi:peptide-methionine (S)-S-oxide reductase